MYRYPQRYKIVSGQGRDAYPLVAFDLALVNAGIGNYNLIKVSSILPARCESYNNINVEKGAPILCAYATITSNKVGTKLATAIAVGIPKSKDKTGVIMEYSGNDIDAKEAQDCACTMVERAMFNHQLPIEEIQYSSIEGVVDKESLCLVSAIVMW